MDLSWKGVSTSGEFIILIGVILTSVLFLLTFQKTVTQETEVVTEMSVKQTGKRISGLMNRLEVESSHIVKSVEIPKTTIEVKNGILTVKRKDETFSEAVPVNSKDVFLKDSTKVVILKEGGKIKLFDEMPVCNFNFFCEPKECFSDCEDCYGPSPTCVGDGNCTKAIGETCRNSPQDCACESGKECCPGHPDSDENSCLDITERKDKGEQCYCNNQCSDNLNCNPTHRTFKEFEKGCCPQGKGWNGKKCVDICKMGNYDRFTCNVLKPAYNKYLDVCHQTVKSKIRKWIFSDPTLENQVLNDNFDNAVRKIWKKSFKKLYEGNFCRPPCTGTSKSVNKLIDGSVSCGVCNHWAAVGTSLIRTLGVPKDRIYSLTFRNMGGVHAATGYKSDSGEWWILDYTCCGRLVKAKNWDSCGRCECLNGLFLDNDHYSGKWKSNKVGGIC